MITVYLYHAIGHNRFKISQKWQRPLQLRLFIYNRTNTENTQRQTAPYWLHSFSAHVSLGGFVKRLVYTWNVSLTWLWSRCWHFWSWSLLPYLVLSQGWARTLPSSCRLTQTRLWPRALPAWLLQRWTQLHVLWQVNLVPEERARSGVITPEWK